MTLETIKSHDSTGALLLKYWPIVLAGALGFLSLGGIYVKLDYIAEAMKENKQSYMVIADRQSQTTLSIARIEGDLNQQKADTLRNAQTLTTLESRLNILAEKARWAPK